MCIYSPVPHTLSCCVLIGKCALIRSNTVNAMKRHTAANFIWQIYVVKGFVKLAPGPDAVI